MMKTKEDGRGVILSDWRGVSTGRSDGWRTRCLHWPPCWNGGNFAFGARNTCIAIKTASWAFTGAWTVIPSFQWIASISVFFTNWRWAWSIHTFRWYCCRWKKTWAWAWRTLIITFSIKIKAPSIITITGINYVVCSINLHSQDSTQDRFGFYRGTSLNCTRMRGRWFECTVSICNFCRTRGDSIARARSDSIAWTWCLFSSRRHCSRQRLIYASATGCIPYLSIITISWGFTEWYQTGYIWWHRWKEAQSWRNTHGGN